MTATPLHIYSIPEIWDLPDPVWQVEDLIGQRSLFGLYGPSGHGKTFVALHLALCVATGITFLGKPVVQGSVVYVYAEGAPNLKHRVQAWLKQHGRDPSESNIWFIPTAVDLMDPKGQGLADLLETIEAVVPDADLVIIDTLAKCFGSASEDATSDMNTFTNRCAVIRDHFGCTVGVVHHTGHLKSRERGNRAFRSNSDTFIRCSKRSDRDEVITLKCEKQKDASPFDDLKLRLRVVSVGSTTSCTVILAEGSASLGIQVSADMKRLLSVLHSFGPEGISYTAWKDAATQGGMSESRFKRTRSRLVEDGLVTKPPESGSTGFTYRLASSGRVAIGVEMGIQTPDSLEAQSDLGPIQVQSEEHTSEGNTNGVNLGSFGVTNPRVELGSGARAYRARPEPTPQDAPATNGKPITPFGRSEPCAYCGEHKPRGCGLCGLMAIDGGLPCSQ